MANTVEELKSHFEQLASTKGYICEGDCIRAFANAASPAIINYIGSWLVSSKFRLCKGVGQQYKQELLERVLHPNIRDVKDTKDHTHHNKDKKQESKKKVEEIEVHDASMRLNQIIEESKCKETEDEFLPAWKKRNAAEVPELGTARDPVDQHLAMVARSTYTSTIKKKVKFDNDTVFTVDVAETPAQKAAGLEVFDSLSERAGLLFPFAHPDHVTFHMGCVKFPIDILFLMHDDLGLKVAKIVHNANPGDLDLWSCPDTACVLEIPGGSCNKLGIGIDSYCKISDRIEVA
jgi:hypothetical protein